MYLIDTNILIYFYDGQMTEAQKHCVTSLLETSFHISVISKMEFLGFKEYMNDAAFEKAKSFLSEAVVIGLTDDIIDETINIRQRQKMKLADAIIAATAKTHQLSIVTRNTDDFKGIDVAVLTPFAPLS